MGGSIDSSLRSSKALIKLLFPGSRANKIPEDNLPIKTLCLGLSRIDDFMSSIPGVGKEISHAAFLLGTENKFQNKCIILDYGDYKYLKDEKLAFEYNEEGGLRYGYIEYNNFQKEFGKAAMIKLDLSKSPPVRFNALIDKLKEKGSWKQIDYSNINHNCQHFAVEVIKILKPKFTPIGILPGDNAELIEGKDVEEIIPGTILEQLKKNT